MGDPALRGDIENRVLAVLREILALDGEPLDLDASIVEDLAATSLDRVSLFMALEDEFSGTLPDQEVQQIKTVRDIVDFIECRLQMA